MCISNKDSESKIFMRQREWDRDRESDREKVRGRESERERVREREKRVSLASK